MAQLFKTIGIMGRQRTPSIVDTLQGLKTFLKSRKLDIIIEEETAVILPADSLPVVPRNQIGKHCDLMIVVGGDGSLLNAAHAVVHDSVPVLGINRGRLGFLTDIHPNELNTKVGDVLDGSYLEEERFLLTTQIRHFEQVYSEDNALNDVVLLPGDVAHMIEFSIYIDKQFVCTQRADGLIVATPTGSTAYALSGGGPILYPTLDAVVLVPMFPHTLSNRPIVIGANSKITLVIAEHNETSPQLSCDGQQRIPVKPGDSIHITKKAEKLRLIHPKDYNYFQTLRTKLHWISNF